ncbi:hypothetical protein GCM10027445_45770 [Amycolatopsis endophytica]|uniref:DUF1795 domain-containing protein n=1 Tax=Amycolatopsis endophytica TaxID=860233 RepID=A0A853B170_9PSEU|nr:hypothetical protein [Amycolatopsis endophytica]NYI88531.1 hypothetical protein [Amycolatopsis endophytica]
MTLPVPVHFGLPDGWEPVAAGDVPFAAMRSPTAGIMLTGGVWPTAVPLAEVAAEAVADLRETAPEVTVLSGDTIADGGYVQELRFTVDDEMLVRSEVYLVMGAGREQRAVVRAALTCTDAEFPALADDFRSFVGSLGPDV